MNRAPYFVTVYYYSSKFARLTQTFRATLPKLLCSMRKYDLTTKITPSTSLRPGSGHEGFG